jgi:hypothetical protein
MSWSKSKPQITLISTDSHRYNLRKSVICG